MHKTKATITLQELYHRYEKSRSLHKEITIEPMPEFGHSLLGHALSLPESEQLQFLIPSLEQWGTFISSLLKFAFPPSQIPHTYRRFAIQWLANARVTKKHIHKLSWPALEWLLQQLCLETLSASLTDTDLSLQLWWLTLDISEFQIARLLQGDIHLFSQEDPSRLHSYYYQGQLDQATLTHLLTAHGFLHTSTSANVSWLDDSQLSSLDDNALILAYWIVRRLAFPLPWNSLLSAFQNNASLWLMLLEHQPLLALMGNQLETLKKTGKGYLPINCNYQQAMDALNLYQDRNHEQIAEGLLIERPYEYLVLVEGTTEAILLPVFAALYCQVQANRSTNHDQKQQWLQNQQRIYRTLVMPVGGKNQMFAMYRALANDLAIPVGVLLDQDAAKTYQQLQSIKRDSDPLLMIAQGEMEDLYDIHMLITIINEMYHPHPVLTKTLYDAIVCLEHPLVSSFHGIQRPTGRVEELRLIWQVFSFGRFDKVELAEQIASFLSNHMFENEMSHLMPTVVSPALASYIGQLYHLPEHE